MKAMSVCSDAIAFGERYSKGITAATRLGNSRAPSHTKNDAIPANGVTAFGVVYNFSSSEPKSGLKFNVSFCAAWAVSVLFTPPLFACLPARNDFFQKPDSGSKRLSPPTGRSSPSSTKCVPLAKKSFSNPLPESVKNHPKRLLT
jgi:hypothetical protein